jgi:hypothetical protein
MKWVAALLLTCYLLANAQAAPKPAEFVAAKPDPLVGDWQGEGGVVAQVSAAPDGTYQANLLKAFDAPDKPVAVLRGDKGALTGDGWTATLQADGISAQRDSQRLHLRRVERPSPTLGVSPPTGAVVLFGGKSLDAFATKAGKEWLKQAGPAKWKIVDGGAVEVVPGTDCLISKQIFGDCRVHLEFRTLGAPTNSGVYLQTRYEVNISETYGRLDGNPTGGLDNCTDKVPPRVRASRPPLAWQTLDIDFRAPRFDREGKKSTSARATVSLNGTKLYEDQELNSPHGAAGRLGEAPTGPLMLQEHGVPIQFRNVWVVPQSP